VSATIWMAAAECGPLAQTGGLGDVLRALPPALARLGFRVTRFLPAYGSVDRAPFRLVEEPLPVPLGPGRVPVRFLSRAEPDGVVTTLVLSEELFGREGIYGPPGGAYPDNARRFVLLSRAVFELARRAAASRPHPAAADGAPDVLHVHDWHTALVPLFVRHQAGRGGPVAVGVEGRDRTGGRGGEGGLGGAAGRPGTVLTIHNIGYQGRFAAEEGDWLGLDGPARARVFVPGVLEDHGGVNFLKAGLACADRIAAVSPTYAGEIRTPEGGFGLDAVLRGRGGDVSGILNGADYDVWDPRTDPHLPRPYGPDDPAPKAEAAAALRRAFGLPAAGRPILGVVSRLVEQKGIDLVAAAVPDLLALGADLAILGAGEPAIAAALERARQEAGRDRVGLIIAFNERLSHLVTAGSDLFLLPSRYEPCGLTQMHALRYGTIPVGRRTGGLADTIRDETEQPGQGNGFLFEAISAAALVVAVRRGLEMKAASPAGWRGLQGRAMADDFSWDRAAAGYAGLYRAAAGAGTHAR
jgi:starch synthase